MRSTRLLLTLAMVTGAFAPVASQARVHRPWIERGVTDLSGPGIVLARFEHAVPTLEIPGLEVTYRFGSVPAIVATATPAAARMLASQPGLVALELDKRVELDLDSAIIASNAKDVTDPTFKPETPPMLLPNGDRIDGSGVGIAIVDVGIDGLHPDFQAPGKLVGNYRATPAGVVPAPYSVEPAGGDAAGHGSHVAGIAAGNGAASGGQYRGVAPGASLYGFGMYNGSISAAAVAFDWILQNGASQSPPIRVVNNSWHCDTDSCPEALNPEMLHVRLASQLANSGFTVAWAAGNASASAGNDGVFSSTNIEIHNQTPGIIGVANYADHQGNTSGRRDLCIYSSSARGASSDPTTWPDVAAPGTNVMSVWGIAPSSNSRLPDGTNNYRALSGTSMASPHVAGIAALMLQANPSLSPAEVEYLLKATADELSCGVPSARVDATHPFDDTNHIEGHGLVDAAAAVQAALTFDGIPPAPALEELPDAMVVTRPGIDRLATWYLVGDTELSTAYPAAEAPKPMQPNTYVEHTTAPLSEPVTAEAVVADIFMGTTGEVVANFNPPRIHVIVDRIDGTTGEIVTVAETQRRLWQIPPLQPTHRDYAMPLPTPVTFGAGDQLRLRLGLISPPLQGVDPPPIAFWDLYQGSPAASRVALGEIVERPTEDSRAWCEARQDCADIGGDVELSGMTCAGTPVLLTWKGPIGSALIASCNGQTVTCPAASTTPGDLEGTCSLRVEWRQPVLSKGGFCGYRTVTGERGGKGRCLAEALTEDDD